MPPQTNCVAKTDCVEAAGHSLLMSATSVTQQKLTVLKHFVNFFAQEGGYRFSNIIDANKLTVENCEKALAIFTKDE